MKKIFLPLSLCFLFLTLTGIASSEAPESIKHNEQIPVVDGRVHVFRTVLNRLDNAVNAIQEEAIVGNAANVIRNLRTYITADADIFVLNGLRRVFTLRILNFIEHPLDENRVDLFRATSEFDAVVQEFDERRLNGQLH
jgi:hypothetical protein